MASFISLMLIQTLSKARMDNEPYQPVRDQLLRPSHYHCNYRKSAAMQRRHGHCCRQRGAKDLNRRGRHSFQTAIVLTHTARPTQVGEWRGLNVLTGKALEGTLRRRAWACQKPLALSPSLKWGASLKYNTITPVSFFFFLFFFQISGSLRPL